MRRALRACHPELLLLLVVLAAAALRGEDAYAAAVVQVVRITVQDDVVEVVTGVLVRAPGADRAQPRPLRRGEGLDPGSEIILPALTVVVLRSVNGNELTLNPGVLAQINDVTDAGERYTVVQGVVQFVVNRALNFFDVVFEEFQASVRGTRFTLEIVPGEVYRCTVDRGALMVRRPRIFAIQEGGQAVRVPMQQVKSLGGEMERSVEWTRRSLQADQTFASFREARAQIEGQLERALSDPPARRASARPCRRW